MNAILEQINSTGKIFVEFALPMLVQSSVLILILLLTDFALRKKVRAVFRYGIWLLVLIKLVLPTSLSSPLSLGYFFGDGLAYVDIVQIAEEPHVTVVDPTPASVPPFIDLANIEAGRHTSAVAPIIPETEPAVTEPINSPVVSVTPVTWQGAVFLAWLTVVMAMGLLLLQRAFFVRGLVAQAKEANSLMNDTFVHCCERMGVKRKLGLKVSANATSPAVCGLFRPVILVPQNLTSSLSKSQLRAVLLHELAHIKRGDLWVNLAQTFLQIIYFYNPLLWAANLMIRRVREQAVDEMVLVAMGEAARQYPQTLVNVAKLAFKRPALSLRLIGVVESKSALAGRIKHILNRPMPKKAKLGILGLAVVIIIAAILLPMATCTPGPPSLVIKGTVKDARTGEPIAGARVFDDGYGPKPDWEQIKADVRSEWGAITNSAGEYSFLTWPEHHSIKVQAPGYKAERRSLYSGHFVFNKKDEEIFDFALEPEEVVGSSEFKKTLPNGVTVELLGLTRVPAEGQPRWKPDGSVLDEPATERLLANQDPSVDRDYAHFNYYAVMTSITEADGGEPIVCKWQFKQADGYSYSLGSVTRVSDTGVKTRIRAVGIRFPKDAVVMSMKVGISGRWEPSLTFEDYGSFTIGNDQIVLKQAFDAYGPMTGATGDNGHYFNVVHNILDRDVRIVAVDKSGAEHVCNKPYGTSTKGNQVQGIFGFRNLSKEQVQEYRVEVRPYTWIGFDGVSLQPGDKAVDLAKAEKAKKDAELEQWLGQGQTRQIRRLILKIRNCGTIHEHCESQVQAIAAARELVKIGEPAVSELVNEMKREQPWSLPRSLIPFTLRAIGDPQAVPALIEVLEKSRYRGDYGIYVKDEDLANFMLDHQHREPDESDRQAHAIVLSCPVIEITKALEKITGRTESHEHFFPDRDQLVRQVTERWRSWWHQQPDVQVEVEKPQSLIFHGLDLTAVPHTTNSSKLPDLFEERPLGSKSHHIQKDVTAIYSGLDGTVYFIPRRNIFYVQHDKLGSSTLTYYGPFEGNPVQVLNLQPDVQVED